MADARDAGMSVARVQVDWSELEPAPGVYDEVALRESLDGAIASDAGLLFTLSTLDTGSLTIPADFLDGADLRSGLRLSDAEVGERFTAFLRWLVPVLLAEEVRVLSLANEGETLIRDGVVTSEDAAVFLVRGLAIVESIAPRLAAGVTLTSNASRAFPAYSQAVLSASEVALFNFYCLDEALVTTRQPRWESELDAMEAAAGTLPIVFQELGCPTGHDNGSGDLQGSATRQAAFLDYVGARAETQAQIRMVFAFQPFDWSPALAARFAEPLRAEGFPVAAEDRAGPPPRGPRRSVAAGRPAPPGCRAARYLGTRKCRSVSARMKAVTSRTIGLSVSSERRRARSMNEPSPCLSIA